MKFRFQWWIDIQLGRLFFRAYVSKGPGYSLRIRRSPRASVLWFWRLMIEVAWLHGDGCDCIDCIPF